VWDPRQEDPVVSLDPVEGETPADCWTVAFGNSYNDSERCIAAGYDNGDIKMFDLRTMTIRWDTNVRNGVCHLAFDRRDIRMNKLGVSTLESNMIIYDLRTYHPEEGFAGRKEKVTKATLWGFHFLPQNRESSRRAAAMVRSLFSSTRTLRRGVSRTRTTSTEGLLEPLRC